MWTVHPIDLHGYYRNDTVFISVKNGSVYDFPGILSWYHNNPNNHFPPLKSFHIMKYLWWELLFQSSAASKVTEGPWMKRFLGQKKGLILKKLFWHLYRFLTCGCGLSSCVLPNLFFIMPLYTFNETSNMTGYDETTVRRASSPRHIQFA